VSEILVEVSASSSGDLSAHPSAPELLDSRADELAGSIAEIAAKLSPRLDAGMQAHERDPWMLDRVELRFDVSLAVEGGVLIAKSSGTGTFTVRLTWQSAINRPG
jgi:Trypsin-co-occurring domain 1